MSLIRAMKKAPSEELEKRLAELIINELESYNWSITLKEPGRPAG
jgi:hypothetical protein